MIRLIGSFLFAFAFTLVGTGALAQEVVAGITVDTNKILIGKPVSVLLRLSQPKTLSVNWPLFTDSMGQLEVLQVMPVDTLNVEDDNSLVRTQTITVTSFDSGTYILPEVSFSYRAASSDKLLTASTDPLTIQVFTVPVDTSADIRDIRTVEKAPFDTMLLIWILVAVLAVILILTAIWWYRRKKRKSTLDMEKVPEQIIPAHVAALEALKNLEEERLWQNGKVKQYYTGLTDILRIYIGQRWGLNALELTSDEILSGSFMVTLSKEISEDLERLLRLADLVKFAKLLPQSAENESSIQLAVKFVNNTALQDAVKMETIEK